MRRFSASVALLGALILGYMPTPTAHAAPDTTKVSAKATMKKMGKGDLCSKIYDISDYSYTDDSQPNIFFRQRWFDVSSDTCWSVHQTSGRKFGKVQVLEVKTNRITGVEKQKVRVFEDAYSIWGIADINKFDVDVQIWVWGRNTTRDPIGWLPVYLNGTRAKAG